MKPEPWMCRCGKVKRIYYCVGCGMCCPEACLPCNVEEGKIPLERWMFGVASKK